MKFVQLKLPFSKRATAAPQNHKAVTARACSCLSLQPACVAHGQVALRRTGANSPRLQSATCSSCSRRPSRFSTKSSEGKKAEALGHLRARTQKQHLLRRIPAHFAKRCQRLKSKKTQTPRTRFPRSLPRNWVVFSAARSNVCLPRLNSCIVLVMLPWSRFSQHRTVAPIPRGDFPVSREKREHLMLLRDNL